MSNEPPINTKKYKKQLLKHQQELLDIEDTGNEAAKIVELDQACVGRLSRMDALQSQAMSVESKRRRALELAKIESALLRISHGEYGFCLRCEEQIASKRLTFDPAASLCINCAAKAENSN
jgi:DnaK suppressor protein